MTLRTKIAAAGLLALSALGLATAASAQTTRPSPLRRSIRQTAKLGRSSWAPELACADHECAQLWERSVSKTPRACVPSRRGGP